MITVYTNKDKIPANMYEMLYVESYFSLHIRGGELSETQKYFMKKIDGALLLEDEFLDAIITQAGLEPIDDLSSSCMLLMTIEHILQNNLQDEWCFMVDICDENSLKLLFEVYKDSDISVYLNSSPYIPEIFDIQVLYNGNSICTLKECFNLVYNSIPRYNCCWQSREAKYKHLKFESARQGFELDLSPITILRPEQSQSRRELVNMITWSIPSSRSKLYKNALVYRKGVDITWANNSLVVIDNFDAVMLEYPGICDIIAGNKEGNQYLLFAGGHTGFEDSEICKCGDLIFDEFAGLYRIEYQDRNVQQHFYWNTSNKINFNSAIF